MNKRLYFILFMVVSSCTFAQSIFTELPTLSVDFKTLPICAYGDTLYVAHYDAPTRQHTIYAYYNNDWRKVGESFVLNGYAVEPAAMVANASGIYALFSVSARAQLKPTVMHWNGRQWHTLGKELFTTDYSVCMDITAKNKTPYVVCNDLTYKNKATVYSYTNGDWNVFGEAGFSKPQTENAKIAAWGDTILVSYFLEDQSIREMQKWTGKQWQSLSKGDPFKSGETTTFGFETNADKMYISYIDNEAANATKVFAYERGTWVDIQNKQLQQQACAYSHLALHNNDLLLVYENTQQNNNVYFRTFSQNIWSEGKQIAEENLQLITACQSETSFFVVCVDAAEKVHLFHHRFK